MSDLTAELDEREESFLKQESSVEIQKKSKPFKARVFCLSSNIADDNYSNSEGEEEEEEQQQEEESEKKQATTISASSCCSKMLDVLLKKFRVEIVGLLMTALLAVPVYFIIMTINSEFDFHSQCVACLASSGFVFDEEAKSCVSLANLTLNNSTNESHSQLMRTIVFKSAFCGAARCQKQQILPSVRLVPYWIMIVSSIFAVFGTIIFNILKKRLFTPTLNCLYRCCNWKIEPAKPLECKFGENDSEVFSVNDIPSEEGRNQISQLLSTFAVFGMIDPHYYLFLYVLAHAHFFYLVAEVTTNAEFSELSGWKKYETLYLLWMNSGTLQVLLIAYSQFIASRFASELIEEEMISIYQQVKSKHPGLRPFADSVAEKFTVPLKFLMKEDSKLTYLVTHVVAPFLLPIFLTHCLPSVFIFFPVFCFIMIIFSSLYRVFVTDAMCDEQCCEEHCCDDGDDALCFSTWSSCKSLCCFTCDCLNGTIAFKKYPALGLTIIRVLSTFVTVCFVQTLRERFGRARNIFFFFVSMRRSKIVYGSEHFAYLFSLFSISFLSTCHSKIEIKNLQNRDKKKEHPIFRKKWDNK